MPTDVFHIDANGVRIGVDRAVFGEHAYATRNISGVATVEDKGVRWPGQMMLALGFALLGAGFLLAETTVVVVGAVAVLSGSLNLGRKRANYGVRIATRRGPVYVLASRDKQYTLTVAAALRRAVSAAAERRESAREERAEAAQEAAPAPADGGEGRARGRRFRRRRR